jgi:hypothetical protein
MYMRICTAVCLLNNIQCKCLLHTSSRRERTSVTRSTLFSTALSTPFRSTSTFHKFREPRPRPDQTIHYFGPKFYIIILVWKRGQICFLRFFFKFLTFEIQNFSHFFVKIVLGKGSTQGDSHAPRDVLFLDVFE